MKLIVVLSIIEEQECVARLLHEAGLVRFSSVPISGYKKRKECSSLSWFGRGSRCEKTNSLMLFSFADEELAHRVVERVDRANAEGNHRFPLHAFVLDVSEFSKFM